MSRSRILALCPIFMISVASAQESEPSPGTTDVHNRFLKRLELGTGLLHVATGNGSIRYSVNALTFGASLSLGYNFSPSWALAATNELYFSPSPLFWYRNTTRIESSDGVILGARAGLTLSYRKLAKVSDLGITAGLDLIHGHETSCDCYNVAAALNQVEAGVYIAPYVTTQWGAEFRLAISRHHKFDVTSYLVMPQLYFNLKSEY